MPKPTAPHPLEAKVPDPTMAASPYKPDVNDPFPRRPREIVCELLGFGIPLSPTVHNSIARHGLDEVKFGRAARALVMYGRQGLMEVHLAVARERNLIGGTQDSTNASQLFNWARETCGKEYQAAVAIKRRQAKNAKPVLALTDADREIVQLHRKVQAVYEAQKEARLGPLQQKMKEVQEELARLERELAAEFVPVSKVKDPTEKEVIDWCCARLGAARGVDLAPEQCSEEQIATARKEFEAQLRTETLAQAYRNNPKRSAQLQELSQRGEGGAPAAKKPRVEQQQAMA